MLFDNHIHIGQFEEVYYDGLEVIETVMSAGMGGLAFSSTSSCTDNVHYGDIEKEIQSLLRVIRCPREKIIPYFWYIPDYIDQEISVESAFASIPYQGFKLHPYAHSWDFANSAHCEALHRIFDYAAKNILPVLIHTGHSGVDSADRFEPFFREYKSVVCVLAHCRPLDTTLTMLAKYENVFCDTAFVPPDDIRRIAAEGYNDRILFGTDFPITHYFAEHADGKRKKIPFRRQYLSDILQKTFTRHFGCK